MDCLWVNVFQPQSPWKIELFGSLIVQLFWYWVEAFINFTLADLVGPSWFKTYKLHPLAKQSSLKSILKCLPDLLQNQLLSTILYLLQLGVLCPLIGQFYHIPSWGCPFVYFLAGRAIGIQRHPRIIFSYKSKLRQLKLCFVQDQEALQAGLITP